MCKNISSIDITSSCGNIQQFMSGWHVSQDYNGSDHRPIVFKVNLLRLQTFKSRVWSRCNWPVFQQNLELGWSQPPLVWYRDIIENESKYLYSRINQAIEAACPLVTTKYALKLSWWSDKLSSLRREVRRPWHWQCCNPSEFNFSEFKRIQKSYKQNIRRTKRSSWKKFCSDIEDNKGISFLNKIIQAKNKSKTVGMLVKPDGDFTSRIILILVLLDLLY